jgi:hypothetical protein
LLEQLYSVVYATSGNVPNSSLQVPVTVLSSTNSYYNWGTNICAGDALPTLSISFTGTADWTYTLNGVQATTSNNPEVITPTTGGTYTVTTVTDANCTNTGNSSSTFVNITTLLLVYSYSRNGVTPLRSSFHKHWRVEIPLAGTLKQMERKMQPQKII